MRQTLIAVTLTAALLAGRPALLDQLWVFLGSIWSESASDEGCGADPNGRCSPIPPSEADIGCGMDPNGGCKPAPPSGSDIGCIMDPNGCPKGS